MDFISQPQEIPLSQLKFFRNRSPGPLTGEQVEELIRHYRSCGYMKPLLIRTTEEEDRFEVIVGHQRLLLAEALGFEKVSAVACTMSDREALAMNDSHAFS